MYGWNPGIGDPTVYGWVTVFAYALGAIACWVAAQHALSNERRFWLLLTFVMVFLCINKQLDLQELFTDFGRFEAKSQGWYNVRHRYQVEFIALITVLGLLAGAVLLAGAKRASAQLRGATLGLIFLMAFIIIRASSFNKVDWFIKLHLGGFRANHLMELGGIAIITLFAFAAARQERRQAA